MITEFPLSRYTLKNNIKRISLIVVALTLAEFVEKIEDMLDIGTLSPLQTSSSREKME